MCLFFLRGKDHKPVLSFFFIMGYLHTADFTEYQGGENILLYFDWGCNSIVDFEAPL